MNKKIMIAVGFISFVMGWYFESTFSESDWPEYLMIRRDGKPLAYAFSSPEHARIVNMPDVPDPGVYIAFPIYSDRNKIDRMVS